MFSNNPKKKKQFSKDVSPHGSFKNVCEKIIGIVQKHNPWIVLTNCCAKGFDKACFQVLFLLFL